MFEPLCVDIVINRRNYSSRRTAVVVLNYILRIVGSKISRSSYVNPAIVIRSYVFL